MYNPRACGALCDRCPLNGNNVVPPEYGRSLAPLLAQGRGIAFVGEAPGEQEERQQRPFCLVPETLVLMADLTWRALEDVKVGDKIIAMDELPRSVDYGVTRYAARQWRIAEVTAWYDQGEQEVVTVVTEMGELTGTPDHRVLSGSNPRVESDDVDSWYIELGKLQVPRSHGFRAGEHVTLKGSKLVSVGSPWTTPMTFDAGWLSGFMDGEGHVSGSKGGGKEGSKRSLSVGYSQNEGPVLEKARKIVESLGFTYGVHTKSVSPDGVVCFRDTIAGGFIQSVRFLGMIQAIRLIKNFQFVLERQPLGTKSFFRPRVLGRYLGAKKRRVIDITTTTGTFIANGFVVHNCGPSGDELNRAMYMAGINRSETLVTNTILCRPPGNKLKDLEAKVNKENKKREKEHKEAIKLADALGNERPPKPEPLLTPTECCRPRLTAELEPFRNFVLMGGAAVRAVTGSTASVTAIRGGLMNLVRKTDGVDIKVMPSIHPAFALRQPKFLAVFRNDILKANRWFRGIASWNPPAALNQPTPQQFRDFLARHKGEVMAYDLETDSIEVLEAKVRCFSIGNQKECVGISILGKDGFTRFYSEADEAEIIQILKEYCEDPNEVKFSWNGLSYDAPVLMNRYGIKVVNHIDGILLKKSASSELPHGLGFVGSIYTEAPAWKTDRESGNKIADSAETDEQLNTYCTYDVAITETVLHPLVQEVKLRDQLSVWRFDQRVQEVCSGMHHVGMFVDQAARQAKETELLARRYNILTEIRERLGKPTFNPGSVYQVSEVLFDQWKLEAPLDDKERFTSSGNPSTGDLVLRSLLTDGTIPEDQRTLLKLIRYYRKVQKVLGTYVTKLRPTNMTIESDLHYWDEDEEWVDKETRERYGIEKRGIVNPLTGRMHPGWSNVHPTTGRISSFKPMNAMNYPQVLRGMVTCHPGNVLVGADSDQIEVRVAASVWQIQKYLQAFREGKDAHSMTAFLVFGEAFCKLAGLPLDAFDRPGMLVGTAYDSKGTFIGKGEVKELRTLSKITHLASQYMAGLEQVHKIIQSTEVDAKGPDGKPLGDGTTDLPYAKLPLKETRNIRDKWMTGAPEYEKGWKREIEEWKKQGYLRDPVNGRRRDFLDSLHGSEDQVAGNEIVNFKIQCITGNTKVFTKDGMIPVQDLLEKKFDAFYGDGFAPAIAVQKGTADIIRVHFSDGTWLECDKTHGFKCVGDRDEFIWRAVANPELLELKVGDWICRAKSSLYRNARNLPEEWMWYTLLQVTAIEETGRHEPVYTLCVDHPLHQYVAGSGVICKNSAAAALMSTAMIQVYEQIPPHKWGPGTGLINQCHDHLVVECPESEAEWVKGVIEEAMNVEHPALPGVKFTATAEIGKAWNKV